MREEIGKYCLDVSKLILGGVVIAAIMKQDIHLLSIVIFGSIAVVSFTLAGFLFIKYKE